MIGNSETPEKRLDRFTELLTACQTRLLSRVFALVQNIADAEDIYQRAAITLWNNFDQFEPGSAFHSWAFKVMEHEAMNFVRRRRREQVFFSDSTLQAIADTDRGEESALQEESKWSALEKCLEKLPDYQRTLIRLYYGGNRIEGIRLDGVRSIAQVASQLGRTEGSVRLALCRVRKLLRECVKIVSPEELA